MNATLFILLLIRRCYPYTGCGSLYWCSSSSPARLAWLSIIGVPSEITGFHFWWPLSIITDINQDNFMKLWYGTSFKFPHNFPKNALHTLSKSIEVLCQQLRLLESLWRDFTYIDNLHSLSSNKYLTFLLFPPKALRETHMLRGYMLNNNLRRLGYRLRGRSLVKVLLRFVHTHNENTDSI